MHKDLNPAAAPAATPSTNVPAKLDAYWMPFTANRAFKRAPRLLAEAKDMYYDARRTPDPRRDGRPLVRQRRPCREPDRRGDRGAGGRDGLRAAVPDGASAGVRARREARRDRPRGTRPRLLRQLRIGGGRHRAQDRARLLARRRPSARASSAASAATTASASAESPSAASPEPEAVRAQMSPASTICRTRTTCAQRLLARTAGAWRRARRRRSRRIVAQHDASTIAAVIVEPVAGSTGVLIPPEGLSRAAARDLRRSTASCSSSTRSSRASAASARRSRPTTSASRRT